MKILSKVLDGVAVISIIGMLLLLTNFVLKASNSSVNLLLDETEECIVFYSIFFLSGICAAFKKQEKSVINKNK